MVGSGAAARGGAPRGGDAAGARVTSQRVDPEEHPAGLPDFLRRHDAFLQVLVTVLGHAYGAPAHDVFQLTRAVMHDRWAAFGAAGEDVRVVELTLQVTRNARALGDHCARAVRHRPRPAHPPAARSVLAARSFEPGWRHPDPWRLLAADEARPLRALGPPRPARPRPRRAALARRPRRADRAEELGLPERRDAGPSRRGDAAVGGRRGRRRPGCPPPAGRRAR